jgi:hypothetical protein
MLIGGEGLAGDAAKKLGLSVSFPLNPEIIHSDGFSADRNYVNLQSFLSAPRGDYSNYEIIDAIANAGGGVHHKATSELHSKIIERLMIKDPNLGHSSLVALGKLVLDGLNELNNALDGLGNDLVQKKKSRQPILSTSGLMIFDGSRYLECFFNLDFTSDFSLALSAGMAPNFKDDECLLEVGNRTQDSSISIWRVAERDRISSQMDW